MTSASADFADAADSGGCGRENLLYWARQMKEHDTIPAFLPKLRRPSGSEFSTQEPECSAAVSGCGFAHRLGARVRGWRRDAARTRRRGRLRYIPVLVHGPNLPVILEVETSHEPSALPPSFGLRQPRGIRSGDSLRGFVAIPPGQSSGAFGVAPGTRAAEISPKKFTH